MTQKNKILKALKIINKRTPKTYPKLEVKIYKTVYSMIKADAKEMRWTYKELGNWTSTHWEKSENKKQDYINTKYYNHNSNPKHFKDFLEVTAYASELIKINIQNTNKHTSKNYIFLLLHELGHLYYKKYKYKNYLNEHLCDKFAIRWIKKFLKEGLIKQ